MSKKYIVLSCTLVVEKASPYQTVEGGWNARGHRYRPTTQTWIRESVMISCKHTPAHYPVKAYCKRSEYV